jgi:eukaryotic-like serine/threonine-protein kinase
MPSAYHAWETMTPSRDDHMDKTVAGRYRLLSVLGSGGMGRVYLAEDEVLHRRVAVKLLLPHHADDPRFAERFRREARAAAALSHPHVVAVYDLGEDEGTPYIVMQCVRGETLKEVIAHSAPLSEADARRICREVLEAAGHAHEQGVVHRDLSARNIIIDQKGRVLVADFGIARLGVTPFTTGAVVVGTAHYAAPEQVDGRGADARSDLYTIGVVLYEMLTGRLPFEGGDAVAVAHKHVTELPPRPSEVRPGISPELEAAILKAMAKDPADRFQTAQEFAQTLALAGATGSAGSGAGEDAAAVVPRAVSAASHTQFAGASVDGRTKVLWDGQTAVLHTSGRRPHRRCLLLALALAAVVVAAGGFTAYRLIGRTFPVPQVGGAMQNAAAALLRANGFTVAFSRIYSDRQPAVGRVVRQSPKAGARLAHSRTVHLWVSRGPLHISMPDLGGMSAAQAEAEVKRHGLVGSRLNGKSDDVATGMVFRQVPAVGRPVVRGRAVTYWVSTGPTGVLVDDFIGWDGDKATAVLEAARFHVDKRSSWGWGDSPGTVTKQDPAGGIRLPHGSVVVIWVAVF